MRPRHAPTVRAAGALLALGLTAGAVQASPASWWRSHGSDPLDLAAAALTGPDSPHAVQDAQRDDRSGRGAAEVDTTSAASATCEDCTADASALHVVYLDRPTEATLDNVATAWSQCAGCRSTSLSVQVVVLRRPQAVRANNRSLSVNAACERCLSSAAAFQIVVVGERRDRLSRAAHAELEQWVADLAAAMRVAVPAEATVAPSAFTVASDVPDGQALLDELEALLGDQLGGVQTLERDADLTTGEPAPQPEPAPDGPAPADEPTAAEPEPSQV